MFTEFTLETAQSAYKENKLHRWVIGFLHDHGNNIRLADEIILRTSTCNLIELPLSELKRINGPHEENLIFKEEKDIWEDRVSLLQKSISEGYVPPPLIATDFWSEGVNLADGNHRHEALLRLGYEIYWVVVFTENKN